MNSNEIIKRIKEGNLEHFELTADSYEEEIENMIIELIGELSYIRMKQKITIKDLADRTNISERRLQNIESCRSDPTLKELMQIIKALNLKLLVREDDTDGKIR